MLFRSQNRGEGGAARMFEVTQALQSAAAKDGMFMFVNTLWRANTPQLHIDTDREKAKSAGVSIDELYGTLAATLGTYYVNDFNKYGRTWQVLMSADSAYRKKPEDIGSIFVRSDQGRMVPLSALVNVRYSSGPDTLERFKDRKSTRLNSSH